MEEDYYPWGGEFTTGDSHSCVAVVLLNTDFEPSDNVAIYGALKTENIGVEKIIANVISNPYIRFLIICGSDIRGHRSGRSLVALHSNGFDDQNRIIDAPGAIPYIENLNIDAIKRFQEQVEIVDLIDVDDEAVIKNTVENYISKNPGCFGDSYIAIKMVSKVKISLDDKRALHSKIKIDYIGKINKRG